MKRINNKDSMRQLAAVNFEHFGKVAEADFDERFGEWHVTFFEFDYFHYFNRILTIKDRVEVLKLAYENLQLIAEHEGQLNICGVFVENCEVIEIFRHKNAYAEVTIARSEVLNRWFWGAGYSVHNGGGGFAPSISASDSNSFKTRAEAYLAACDWFTEKFRGDRYEYEPKNAEYAALGRAAVEKTVIEILTQNPHLPMPEFLDGKKMVIQQSLF